MKTSLERSHSRLSNFLLTLISIPGAVGFCGVFAAVMLEGLLPDGIRVPALLISAVAAVLSGVFLWAFKR